MLTTMVGLLFAAAGLWGIVRWWAQLVAVLQGLLPLCLFLGGVVAMIIGMASWRTGDAGKKTPAEPNRK
jgi:succinate-acetate transporter protein